MMNHVWAAKKADDSEVKPDSASPAFKDASLICHQGFTGTPRAVASVANSHTSLGN